MVCAFVAALSFALTGAALAQESPDTVVESFLESHKLTALLAEQLHDRLVRTPPSERGPIAERLAALYAELIESTDDAATRQEWESRARDLLSVAPPNASASLRLDLERARYARAERIIERARLRLADRSEIEEAMRIFDNVAPVFETIAAAAHQDVLAIQRQEESGREYDPELLSRALRDARRRRSLGYYLAAWSNTYLAEFQNAPARAQEALRQFGWLLGADVNQAPELDRVSDSALQFEHVARSAIGVAVCLAVLGDSGGALDWLDHIEAHNDVAESVREQVPVRRLTVLIRLSRWEDVERFVAQRRRGPNGVTQPLPASVARLLAVSALEGEGRGEESRRKLSRLAVADLVQQQEIAQLVDLCTRYGAAPIADSGFIGSHVRGLVAYESARDAHRAESGDPDAPTGNVATTVAYRQAAELLRAAIRSVDAAAYPEARAVTTMLLGMALYFGSGQDARAAAEAAEALETASNQFSDRQRAADALWMAHRAARRAGSGEHATVESDAIAARFIDRFPDDERAGVLRVQLAAGGDLAPEDAVAILIETPRESPAYEASQRHAARLLYDMYRETPSARRDWAALRYAAVAEPLLALDRSRAAAGDQRAAELAITRARRLLDALLSVQTPDAGRAQAALDTLDAVIATGLASPPPENEITFRRMQLALAQQDEAGASRYAAMIRRTGDERYTGFADRAIFNFAVDRWRAASLQSADASATAATARDVVGRGARLLVDGEAAAQDLSRSQTLAIQAAVAHAAFDVWSATGDDESLDLAYRRHVLVLRDQPRDQAALRRLAELAEAKGDRETALSCWRTLSSGLDPNTGAWFESRVRLIELLATNDPDRAREALRQHIALRPDLGPAPWNERFRELAAQLGVEWRGSSGDAS